MAWIPTDMGVEKKGRVMYCRVVAGTDAAEEIRETVGDLSEVGRMDKAARRLMEVIQRLPCHVFTPCACARVDEIDFEVFDFEVFDFEIFDFEIFDFEIFKRGRERRAGVCFGAGETGSSRQRTVQEQG